MWLKIILWFIAIMISFLLFDLSCMLINAASDFENILAVLPIAVIILLLKGTYWLNSKIKIK
jgi:phosphoglycerol transferase MdoB-like AlkP superfamily enzyme